MAKLLLSGGLVVAASIVVQRAGPFLGAMVATLPISVGPAYVFIAFEKDNQFLSDSALAGLVTAPATAIFVVLYSALARRRSLIVCLGGALAGWTVFAWLAGKADWTLASALLLNLLVFSLCAAIATRFQAPRTSLGTFTLQLQDVFLRALLVVSVLAAVLFSISRFGPEATGVAALFPVVFASLAFMLHGKIGAMATAAVFINSLWGLIGLILGLSVLSVAAERIGAVFALSTALLISVGWNAGLVLTSRSRRQEKMQGLV